MEWQSGNRDAARQVLAEGPRCDRFNDWVVRTITPPEVCIQWRSSVHTRHQLCRWAPLLLDWALLEAEERAVDRARELLGQAVKV